MSDRFQLWLDPASPATPQHPRLCGGVELSPWLHAGTFLYVAFMEVIPKEMQSPQHGFSKLGMLCLGFGAMSLLAIWA